MPVLRVALDLPLHRLFDYVIPEASTADIGLRVRVPFGRGEKIGVIAEVVDSSEWPLAQLKPAGEILRDVPPLPADFLRLCHFASGYYQAAFGEVVMQALPVGLKRLDPPNRRNARPGPLTAAIERPVLTDEQTVAVEAIDPTAGFSAHLLHGVTGSGKTEVYLRLIERALAAGKQVLLLVPEINLTPQLEGRVRARFPETGVVSLHSELAEAARERNWRAAFAGEASIVLGTRLSVFTPMPRLGLIVVDEEHDSSFKQQDGMRYSARDVAVFRAHQLGIPILLGSATPSLESWANAQSKRYGMITLRERANPEATLPARQADRYAAHGDQGWRQRTLDGGDQTTAGTRRAKPDFPQPAWLCAGAVVYGLRLDFALYPLCGESSVASGRPALALPPLRL
jgi:primosomal protein N' (replication factor Y)